MDIEPPSSDKAKLRLKRQELWQPLWEKQQAALLQDLPQAPPKKIIDAVQAYWYRAVVGGNIVPQDELRQLLQHALKKPRWAQLKLFSLARKLREHKLFYGDRATLAYLAWRRNKAARYDELFMGRDQIVLPVNANAADFSYPARLAKALAEHNARAQQAFADKLATDPQKAGRNIAECEVRPDPENATKLQQRAPNSERWLPGPRLGKFLFEQGEWHLALEFEKHQDDTVRGTSTEAPTEARTETPSESNATDVLFDLINTPRPTGLFDNNFISDKAFVPEDLRIVIARNPTLVGEASTEQHWRSCFSGAEDNFKYLLRGMRAGVLVAYLAHKDDVEVRYPFMRCLLNPFLASGANLYDASDLPENRILVLGKTYGAVRGSAIDTVFREGVRQFIADYNAPKLNRPEPFHLAAPRRKGDDDYLYDDGEPIIVYTNNLQEQATGLSAERRAYAHRIFMNWVFAKVFGEQYVRYQHAKHSLKRLGSEQEEARQKMLGTLAEIASTIKPQPPEQIVRLALSSFIKANEAEFRQMTRDDFLNVLTQARALDAELRDWRNQPTKPAAARTQQQQHQQP